MMEFHFLSFLTFIDQVYDLKSLLKVYDLKSLLLQEGQQSPRGQPGKERPLERVSV